MGIFEQVTKRFGGRDGTEAAVAPGLQAATDEDPYGLLPTMSEEDYNSLYTEDLTSNAQVYDQTQSAPLAAPENPRQADQATDVGGAAGKIVRMAQSFEGTPYVWGGADPSGFDCSGFLQYVYAKAGVNLPRVSYQQAQAGKPVSMDNLQAGDLVAWDNSARNNGADHVAVYIGGGRIAEAPRPGVPLRIRKLGANEGAWGRRVL